MLCKGSSASLIVDWPFQPACTGSFACLGSQSSLVTCVDATSEIGMSRYQDYSSKLCHRYGPFWPRSLHPRGLRKTWKVVSKIGLVCAVQESEAGRQQCAEGDPGLGWGSSAFSLVDLIFRHTSQVQCWPGFAGSLLGLEARCPQVLPVKLQWQDAKIILARSMLWPILPQISISNHQWRRHKTWKLESKIFRNTVCTVKKSEVAKL